MTPPPPPARPSALKYQPEDIQYSPPLPKKRKFSIGEKLYEQLENRVLLDVILTAGSNKLQVHKALITVVSDVFKDILLEQLSSGDKDMKGVIPLPAGTSVEAAKAFIKVMYLEKVDTAADTDLLLDVMSLCDKFLIQELLDSCISSLIGKIHQQNCLQICEASFKMKKCKKLLDAAFVCVSRNIGQILEDCCTSISSKMWKKILMLEGPNVVEMPEQYLFKQLLKWKNTDTKREEQFQNLIPLIRFPLMDLATIAQIVQPENVLTGEELSDILCYIIGGCKTGKSIPKFICHSRKSKIASNGVELFLLLKNAKPGDFIQLVAEEYVGPFAIPSKVTLNGAGPSTIITTVPGSLRRPSIINISANDVKILNLKIICRTPQSNSDADDTRGLEIIGARNMVTHVGFENCLLHIAGNYNVVSNISCNTGHNGVIIRDGGNYNSISNVVLRNLNFGIATLTGSCGNIIKDFKFDNVRYGVTLETDDNSVENVDYTFSNGTSRLDEDQIAVQILGGCGNKVKAVKCHNCQRSLAVKFLADSTNFHGEFGLVIQSEDTPEPKNNVVSDCGPGGVKLGGENNSLRNVDAADLIIISGVGHKLEKCRASKSSKGPSARNVELVDCNFIL